MFRNYVATDPQGKTATTRYNEAVVRVLLAGYLAWKLLFLPVDRIGTYPRYYETYTALTPPAAYEFLPALQLVGIALAVAFALHYRFRLASFGLGTVTIAVGLLARPHGQLGHFQSLFLAGLLVYLYGVYHAGRRSSPWTLLRRLDPRRDAAPGETTPSVDAGSAPTTSPLRWFLLLTAVVYAGGVYDKLYHVGIAWLRGETLGGYLIATQVDLDYAHPLSELLLQYPPVLTLGAVGVLAFHAAFIGLVYYDLLFDAAVVGLAAFHVSVAVLFGPVFYDQVIFLGFFLNWAALVPDEWRHGTDADPGDPA